jgi:flagellar hook-associated protein 2
MAIDYLNTLGVGSGFDTTAMVTAIVDAEIAPKQGQIDRATADVDVKISGLATLKSAMQKLQSTFGTLNDAREFDFTTLSTTNAETLWATPNGDQASVGSHNVTVNQLAQESIRVSDVVADKNAPLTLSGATENFAFTVNGQQTSLTLSTGDTLEDLATAINDENAGVTARVVQVDNGNYRLFLQSNEPGVANEVTIDTDLTALNIGSGDNLTQPANDAMLTYNGVNISRSSNIISDLVPGLTLNLLTAGGSTTRLEVARDDLSAADSIKALVDSFNEFNTIANELLARASESSEPGAFAGDASIRSIVTQARDLFFNEGSSAGENIKRMSDMGIAVDRDGVFQVDDTKLAGALTNHFEEMKNFFTAGTDDQTVWSPASQGFAGDLLKQLDDYLGLNGMIATREQANSRKTTDLSDDQTELDAKKLALEERYTVQFTTMNRIMSEMNSLKDYLDGQLSNLPFTAKNNN